MVKNVELFTTAPENIQLESDKIGRTCANVENNPLQERCALLLPTYRDGVATT